MELTQWQTGLVQAIVKRDDQGRFPPGQSGNPNGRARLLPELRDAIRVRSDDHREALEAIVANPASEPRDVIKAVALLWSYAYGRPALAVEIVATGQPGASNGALNLSALSTEEFQTFRALMLKAKAAAEEVKP